MAFTVVAFLIFVTARSHVTGMDLALWPRLLCALAMLLLVAAIPKAPSTFIFGLIGVLYIVVLQIGVVINVEGVEKPLFWMLPAGMVIPICAAPLWLTPRHFILGTIAFYLAGVPFVLSVPFTHDDYVLCAMWVAIGIPTATTFHFCFYWFRLSHFLLEEKLLALAETDPLTKLLNRRAFLERAEQMLDETHADGEVVSAIFLDIDRFKSLNDQYGHARGDDALMGVTQVLNDAVPSSGVIGRLGGEEFAVLIKTPGPQRAAELADTLRILVATILRPDGFLTASFGVAHRRPNESAIELLDRADEALLRAKHAGRNRVFVEQARRVERVRATAIDEESDTRVDEEPVVATRWGAFDLFTHYQPVYSLSHQKQVGFEALLRGFDRHGTALQPDTLFAPQSNPGVTELDSLTHHLHLANAAKRLPLDTWLFLNVAPSTFIQAGYEQTLAAIVSDAGLDPGGVVLEILESEGVDVEELALAAWRYRGCGFLIAVDDFGAGHSNLDRLLRIQPDFVKLDGELIRAKSRASDQPLLPTIVSLLHRADMLVVVEGIETTEELILAVESNVDFAQGFLLGRPSATLPSSAAVMRRIDHAFDVIAEGRTVRTARFEAQLAPYLAMLTSAANALSNGADIQEAIAPMAKLDLCKRCFVLDETGRIIGPEIIGRAGPGSDFRLGPLSGPQSGRWDHRPYYWKAVASMGTAVFCQPYLSLTSGRASVGVTMAFMRDDKVMVVGGELDWTSPHLAWPTVE
ncbi:bifunctional diguanylate cyclase/phosphodiesterase [Caballeronia sp. SEWSISQ10-4 2]|uniref:bifunctional diguanylate cyclase/phosphodiesterase n=1 Tax=Caballeronia sp. SEWSISQ10-4 2 TaxID=2937438 RepID=UPI002654AF0F|nr:bifunctional diguanylate cyclase/phosphodiesterase [Caballeronia sp. SEWSISQ10-4 2]MDN7184455.1 bifunctional diguanylate cyclase/phosphodiesterase [Caballeronia sp. SEWSISQ10-4 2]